MAKLTKLTAFAMLVCFIFICETGAQFNTTYDVEVTVQKPADYPGFNRDEWDKAVLDVYDLNESWGFKSHFGFIVNFPGTIQLPHGEYVVDAILNHLKTKEFLLGQTRFKVAGDMKVSIVLEKPKRHMLKTQFLNLSGEPLAGYEIEVKVGGRNTKLEKQNPDSKDFVYITDENGFADFAVSGLLPVRTELSLKRYKYRNCKPIAISHTSWDREDVCKAVFDAKPIGVLKLAVEVGGEIYPLEEGLEKIAEITGERRSKDSIDLSLYVLNYEIKGRWYSATGSVTSSEAELICIPDGEYALLRAYVGGLYLEPCDNFPIVIKNKTIVEASEPLVLVRQYENRPNPKGLYIEVSYKNRPVSNTQISILYPDKYYNGKTGADGSVRISVPAGKYRLKAKHEMYKPVVMDLTLRKAGGNRIDIKMERISFFASLAKHEDVYIVGLIVVGVLIYLGITCFFIYRSYRQIRHKTVYEDSSTKMSSRRGEKAGWIGGWMGSFLWLYILTTFWLLKGFAGGFISLGIFFVAMILIFVLSPWRNPDKKYWILMLPLFVIFVGSAVVAIIVFGGIRALGKNLWMICFLLPLSIPLCSIGRKRWIDGEMFRETAD